MAATFGQFPAIFRFSRALLQTVHCILPLHTSHCTMHSEQWKLHNAQYTLHTAHCTLHTAHTLSYKSSNLKVRVYVWTVQFGSIVGSDRRH